ncbi:hypothetical protein [Bacillus sp. E(2018)]|uniref:hypothetical protein n=1 Tax=Bacillus sp. E(2018) TaxID=2502239 RepID=UPI0010F8B497|nr:hypothetical protein [Bacillus sp. E(2018)]
MDYFRSEKGNTLIIVLLMIVIFTVAGLSLISTTFSGVKKTDARETQIKSVELAEKGIDYVSVLLEEKSKNYIDLTTKDFDLALKNLLSKYEVEKPDDPFLTNSLIPTDEGIVKVKIYDRTKKNADPDDLTQTMTLHSEATVNGKKKTLISKIQLGGRQTPEALNYALGAYNPFPCTPVPSCNSSTDDGNMFLHGGVAIKGDVYVEGNLITRNKGIEGRDNNWITSDLPSIEGLNGKKANLIMQGNIFKATQSDGTLNYSEHILRKNFSGYNSIDKNNPQSAFTSFYEPKREFVPAVSSRIPNFKPIDITGEKSQFYFPENKGDKENRPNFNNKPNNENIRNMFANKNVYLTSNKDVVINGSFTFNRLGMSDTDQTNVTMRSDKSEPNKILFKQGAYINGNLTIGNTSSDGEHYYSNYYEKFEIDGPIYVNGNLTIQSAFVKFNSTIYVTGTTTIRFSRLEGIKGSDQIEKSVVLFGKRPILISNNNVYGDEANIIRGFFYTEDLMEIYGVGSNVEIQGGVFGRKVVLNATRGRVWRFFFNDYYDNNQHNISPDRSRLRITYNPELIKNPPSGLPKVKELSVTRLGREIK